MSYVNLYVHVVFRTKYSDMTISEAHEGELYAYIMGYVKNMGGTLIRVGGMPDHIHILVAAPEKLAFSDFIRDLKTSTSKFLRDNPNFLLFRGWGNGYAAFSCSMAMLQKTIDYINGQKEHHKTVSFADEYRTFILENGGTIAEEYFLKD